MIETRLACEKVDILILAEGTYPFERGGVAAWIYDIISNMPEYNFGVIFLGAFEGQYTSYAYDVPANVVSLQIAYLFKNEKDNKIEFNEYKNLDFEKIVKLHEVFKRSHGCPKGLVEYIDDITNMISPLDGIDYQKFLRSEESWSFIVEQYSEYSSDPSFINYFWNIRNMHEPLWVLQEAVEQAPLTRVVHTISTGYAGLLAGMMQQHYNYPLILSEHGIYTKERNIELLQSSLILSVDMLISSKKMFSYQHQLWLKFFDSLARICYHYADRIISLYGSAQEQQLLGGADVNKTRIIPNGVDIQKFATVRRPITEEIPKIVCFVGRFVRLKDIKTFIRSVRIMINKDSTITAWIKMVGAGDKEYLQECIDFISLLDLKDKIRFVADGDMLDILEKIGLLVLSSISEGMPLVLLESLAAGIPVITTDVGSCREIIEGRNKEDKQLGKCGEVVSIADATMLAEAAVNYLNNRELWLKAQETGITRIERYYNQTIMIDAYKDIYKKAITHGRDRI